MGNCARSHVVCCTSFPLKTHGSNDVSSCGVTTAEKDLKSFDD